MRGYLIDTNVSRVQPRSIASCGRSEVAGYDAGSRTVCQRYVSVLTLAEIERGILRKEEGKRRGDLQRWFDEDLPARFAGCILAFDARVASCRTHLTASQPDKGRPLPTIDSQLAATALAHNLVLVTRNVKDYEGNRR